MGTDFGSRLMGLGRKQGSLLKQLGVVPIEDRPYDKLLSEISVDRHRRTIIRSFVAESKTRTVKAKGKAKGRKKKKGT